MTDEEAEKFAATTLHEMSEERDRVSDEMLSSLARAGTPTIADMARELRAARESVCDRGGDVSDVTDYDMRKHAASCDLGSPARAMWGQLLAARERIAELERERDEARLQRDEWKRSASQQAAKAVAAVEQHQMGPAEAYASTRLLALAREGNVSDEEAETYYLIERNDRGQPEWLAWRGRERREWTDDVHNADRYEWRVVAERDARTVAEATGLDVAVTEHMDIAFDDRGET